MNKDTIIAILGIMVVSLFSSQMIMLNIKLVRIEKAATVQTSELQEIKDSVQTTLEVLEYYDFDLPPYN